MKASFIITRMTYIQEKQMKNNIYKPEIWGT